MVTGIRRWRSRAVRVLAIQSWVLTWAALLAAGEEGRAGRSPGALRRQEYDGFYPFYTREVFEDGGVKVSAIFSMVGSTREANGDGSEHLWPFFYRSRHGEDRRLGLIPFYIRGRGPGGSHDVVLPFFARWQAEKSRHTVLWPLLHLAREPQTLPWRAVPTLFRHGSWPEEDRQRLGVPFLLQLFERRRERESLKITVLNLLNFGEEAGSGLPLGLLSASRDGTLEAHLFPLFAAERGRSSGYFHTLLLGRWWSQQGKEGKEWKEGLVAPLLLSWWHRSREARGLEVLWPFLGLEESARRSTTRVFPFYFSGKQLDAEGAEASRYRFLSLFYGEVEDLRRERTDRYLPLLLSRGRQAPGERVLDVLWPLGHCSRRGEELAVRALPFLDRWKSPSQETLGLGTILYRRYADRARQTVARWAPFPLVHWKTSPEGLVAWAVPAFYHRSETVGDRKVATTLVAPGFLSHLEEKVKGGERSLVRRATHLWPLFGYSRTRSEGGLEEKTWSSAFPFLQLRRGQDAASGTFTSLHAPWPLLNHRSDSGGFDFRLVPALFLGVRAARSYGYLYPLLAVESGPAAKRGFGLSTSLVKWYGDGTKSSFRLDPFLFAFHRAGGETALTGPLGWFRFRSSPESGWFHVLPLGFGERQGDRAGLGVFPFYYGRRYGSGDINYWSPGRFLFIWNSLQSERERHDSLLWKVAELTREAGGDYDFRLFHRLLVNRSVKGQRELAVGPFFRSLSDSQTGRRSFSVLRFLYRFESSNGVETRSVLFIPVSRRKTAA